MADSTEEGTELELPDDAPSWAKTLRDRSDKALKSVKEKDQENAGLRRENALLKSGLGDLSPAKQKALLATHDGEVTPEALRATAVELGFAEPVSSQDKATEDAADGAESIANADKGAGSSGSAVINADQFVSWAPDKQRRFMEEQPVAFGILKEGGEVGGIAFL